MVRSETEPAASVVGAGFHPRFVAHIAATSLSSWGFRFPVIPGVGCELRVMEQLFNGCRYTSAGIRCLERYAPAYLSTLSETLEGTAIRAGYVFEYCSVH